MRQLSIALRSATRFSLIMSTMEDAGTYSAWLRRVSLLDVGPRHPAQLRNCQLYCRVPV
jgi:hypothetical protein